MRDLHDSSVTVAGQSVAITFARTGELHQMWRRRHACTDGQGLNVEPAQRPSPAIQ